MSPLPSSDAPINTCELQDLAEPEKSPQTEDYEIPPDLATNVRVHWVREYLKKGWAVIPAYRVTDSGACSCRDSQECGSKGKHPKGGTGNATKNWTSLLRGWRRDPLANVGIATGSNSEDKDKSSGITVLDFDGQEGEQLFAEWTAKGWIPETLTARTGSGGRHVVFNEIPNLKNGVKPIPGLDLRTDGGFIVVAPSKNAKGSYHWDSFSTPVIDAPQELRNYLLSIAAKEEAAEVSDEAGAIETMRAKAKVEVVAAQPSTNLGDQSQYYRDYKEGTRNRAFFEVACALRGQQAATKETILQELRHRNSKVQSNPYSDAEIVKTVEWVCAHYRPEKRLTDRERRSIWTN